MRRTEAFTLIEILCVCVVLACLAAIAAPAVGFQILHTRVAAETTSLQNMAAAAQASFESTDLEGTNIAALAGAIPSGVDPTQFSTSLDPTALPLTTNANDWFAKIAQQMGYAPQLGVAPALQPQVAVVLINASKNARIMLVGPATEPTQQRFLLVSLVAAAGQLSLPPWPDPTNSQDPADLSLFNDIWNTDWTNPAATLPSSWVAALTPGQIQAWNGNGSSGSRLWQLCVQRIVCPKFSITVNNSHPTDNCYVYYNLNGATAGSNSTVPANSGVSVISGVYFGRLIQAYRGASPPPSAALFSQFNLRDNCEITLQD
jgi:type II secretory pathway pseudopilin PulG